MEEPFLKVSSFGKLLGAGKIPNGIKELHQPHHCLQGIYHVLVFRNAFFQEGLGYREESTAKMLHFSSLAVQLCKLSMSFLSVIIDNFRCVGLVGLHMEKHQKLHYFFQQSFMVEISFEEGMQLNPLKPFNKGYQKPFEQGLVAGFL